MICARCIMDESHAGIEFDEDGNCNLCEEASDTKPKPFRDLASLLDKIIGRATGDYDGVLGISGGIDSCDTALLCKTFGLNLLLTHLNDGFDSWQAEWNVKAVVKNTGWDYIETTVDEDEFRDLFLSHFRAGVVGLESLTDNCIDTAVHNVAKEYGLNNIISGSNWTSEGVPAPAWRYKYEDARNIKAIHKKFGTMPLKSIKPLGLFRKRWQLTFGGVRVFRPLNYVNYNRAKAIESLSRIWSIRDYGRKHQENRLTRFIESYIFPFKYGFDWRREHYSSLIIAQQMTREEALELMEEPLYFPQTLESDMQFFLEKMKLTKEEFDEIMAGPLRDHNEFPTFKWTVRLLTLLRPIKRLFK